METVITDSAFNILNLDFLNNVVENSFVEIHLCRLFVQNL